MMMKSAFKAFLLAVLVGVVASQTAIYTRNVFLGTGSRGGSADGTDAAAARFSNNPFAAVHPLTEEVYYGERCSVRKVDKTTNLIVSITDPSGACTFPPTGIPGPASGASISGLSALTIDSLGNVFFASQDASATIHGFFKIDTSGQISLIVGGMTPIVPSMAVTQDGKTIYYALLGVIYSLDVTSGTVQTFYSDSALITSSTIAISKDQQFLFFVSGASVAQLSKINISSKTVSFVAGSGSTTAPALRQDQVPASSAVLGSINSFSVDGNGNLVIGSSLGVLFLDFYRNTISQIIGNKVAMTRTDLALSGPSLSIPSTGYLVAASPLSSTIYVTDRVIVLVPFSTVSRHTAVFPLPTVSITSSSSSVPETSSSSPVTITVSRSWTDTTALNVPLTFTGTAVLSTDFTVTDPAVFSSNMITIPANQVSATFTLTPVTDAASAQDMTFITTIGTSALYSVGTPSSQTVTIANDASASGDPHMVGFHGQRFDYIGEAGQVINMLSDPDLQVNTKLDLMKAGDHTFIDGPVMREMAFMTRGHTVMVNAGGYLKEESAFVTVDGVLLPVGQSFLDGILSVTYSALSASSSDFGLSGDDHIVAQVEVKLEGLFEFRVFMIENGRDPEDPSHWLVKYPRRFLDFNASLLDLDRRPHGILGQTAAPLSKGRSVGEWTIEGKDQDYVVKDGITGTQFSFNQF